MLSPINDVWSGEINGQVSLGYDCDSTAAMQGSLISLFAYFE